MTKNDLINDVISSLISAFTSEQLEIIKSTFIVKMQNYDIHELCTLPSTEVMDNLYIFKRFSVDMLAKGLKQSTIKTYLTYIRQFFAHNNKNYREITSQDLTRREQEIPHFYKWWDELRYSRRLLDFCISQYYNLIINQSYSLKRI